MIPIKIIKHTVPTHDNTKEEEYYTLYWTDDMSRDVALSTKDEIINWLRETEEKVKEL